MTLHLVDHVGDRLPISKSVTPAVPPGQRRMPLIAFCVRLVSPVRRSSHAFLSPIFGAPLAPEPWQAMQTASTTAFPLRRHPATAPRQDVARSPVQGRAQPSVPTETGAPSMKNVLRRMSGMMFKDALLADNRICRKEPQLTRDDDRPGLLAVTSAGAFRRRAPTPLARRLSNNRIPVATTTTQPANIAIMITTAEGTRRDYRRHYVLPFIAHPATALHSSCSTYSFGRKSRCPWRSMKVCRPSSRSAIVVARRCCWESTASRNGNCGIRANRFPSSGLPYMLRELHALGLELLRRVDHRPK